MAELERFADDADDLDTTQIDDTDAPSEDATDEPDDRRQPLLDPATLPEELRPHWSRMTKAYNQRLDRMRARESEIDDLERRAGIVDQFNANPFGTLQQLAQQYGYRLESSQGGGGQQNGQSNVPERVLQRTREAFRNSPDLAFLAPQIAEAVWNVSQDMVAPMQQQQTQQQQQARQKEHEEALEILDEIAPSWHDREDEMAGLLNFLKGALNGGSLRHPRYGHVYEMAYRAITGNAAATATAGRRFAAAARNATSTGRQRSVPVDVQQQLTKAGSMQDKLQIALRAAMQEHGVNDI
jgi:hypothetical protein